MRKTLLSVFMIMILPAFVSAGFNLGLMKAAKKRVERIDEKVAVKKEEIKVANANPNNATLSWTGEANYISDGINFEVGFPTTTFTFRVKYNNGAGVNPATGYPKVHIKKGGAEILGSPYVMSYISGGYPTGFIYSYSKTLTQGNDYGYYFEAKDFYGGIAAGAPLITIDAPDVSKNALSWTGEANYTSAGLYPVVGDKNTSFVFRVKYTDSNNDAPGPGYPKVHIKKTGNELAGSPFVMSYVSGANNSGAIYNYSNTLSTGTDYTYYFEAQDLSGVVALGAPSTTIIDAPNVVVGWMFGNGNFFGGPGQQTSDGGYIVMGQTPPDFAGKTKIRLIKTDSSGITLWDKVFGGTISDGGDSIQQVIDGGYIITGRTWVDNTNKSNVWLIKTDSAGNIVWNKTFGGIDFDEGKSVQQTADGGYIITGYTNSNGYGGNTGWLIKTDSAGNKSWDKTFSEVRSGNSVQQTSDGGYIITGPLVNDTVMIKTDASGNKLWDSTFAGVFVDTTRGNVGNAIKQTSDGGYIIASSSYSVYPGTNNGHDMAWLIKTDSAGAKLWDKPYGTISSVSAVLQTTDGGYIITGKSWNDLWLMKADSSGTKLWEMTFLGGWYSSEGSGASVQQTSDGGYIIGGGLRNTQTNETNAWVIKTDSNGNPQ